MAEDSPPSLKKIPERTRRRWLTRLVASAALLVVTLSTAEMPVLTTVAGAVGLLGTRRDLVDVHTRICIVPAGQRLTQVAALLHRLAPGQGGRRRGVDLWTNTLTVPPRFWGTLAASEYRCRSCRPFLHQARPPVRFRSRQGHCPRPLGLGRSDSALVALARESREVWARETAQARPLVPAYRPHPPSPP